MSELGVEEFRARLADKGLRLDGKAFEAALKGARQIKGEVQRLKDYLDKQQADAP